jgi:hypothetical protein
MRQRWSWHSRVRQQRQAGITLNTSPTHYRPIKNG